jgi:hypothetical protein
MLQGHDKIVQRNIAGHKRLNIAQNSQLSKARNAVFALRARVKGASSLNGLEARNFMTANIAFRPTVEMSGATQKSAKDRNKRKFRAEKEREIVKMVKPLYTLHCYRSMKALFHEHLMLSSINLCSYQKTT